MSSNPSQGRRTNAAVVRARPAGRAVEQGKSVRERSGGITYRSRPSREGSRPIRRQRRAHPRQRHVRSVRPPFHLVPQIRGGDFHVVMQELEARLPLHAEPYDARAPKVREGANALERQLEWLVRSGKALGSVGECGDPRLVGIADELQREVQLVGGHPGQPGFGIAERRDGRMEIVGRGRRELKGEEESHPHPQSVA